MASENYYDKTVKPSIKKEDSHLHSSVEPSIQTVRSFQDKEKHIVALLKKQDPAVLELLIDAYGATLHGIVLRIVLTKELAEQVIQDTFLKVWHHGVHYDESKGRLFTWFMNIARNTAIDATRNNHFQNRKKIEPIDTLIDSHDGQFLNTDTIGLNEIVKKLDDKYSVLIDLIYFNQYTHQEVAEATGIPLGTVKTRVRYALSELKKTFAL